MRPLFAIMLHHTVAICVIICTAAPGAGARIVSKTPENTPDIRSID